jgi:hypothetical protein
MARKKSSVPPSAAPTSAPTPRRPGERLAHADLERYSWR